MIEAFRKLRPVLGLTLALGLGATACGDSPQDVTKSDKAIITSIAARNGLAVNPEGWDTSAVNPNTVALAINLGACTLQGYAIADIDNNNNVTDIENFGFNRTDAFGHEVAFNFNSLQDLKANLLGPNPCRTLAANRNG
ncbi:MAG: hypothetical protein JWS12_511 [Candidatus Saccharibacteria bacterium]|nr:hypothetical protein [Candidatus Saccharibacteria bacterium]